ncbi:MAG: D-alanyl-D-alanine carboxypeptidase [Firmicutes bacterium]|nr:D-alanyl-D-alanine carboxypeptidase [Bacillota bacterium]
MSANINIQAEAAALIDADTGMLLYGKNADKRMYPASMTKVMTMLVACEKGSLDDMVTVSENAVNSIPWDSSKADLVAGEEISLRDLLYGLILVSGNDAAVVIAKHIGGSEEAFVEMMNEKAKELGCENTHFVNPHGYHDEEHYTTPHDMALIVRAASQNEKAMEIWGNSDHSINATNKHEARVLNHSDKMLQPTTQFYDERIKGGKTGFHNQALNTLASYAVNGDVELVSVIMKDNGYDATYVDTKTLLDFGFSLYKERKLYGRDMFQRVMPVVQHYKDDVVDLGTVNVTVSGDITAYTPEFINSDTVGVKYELPQELEAPVSPDVPLGTLSVTYGDIVLGTLDLIPETAVDAVPESKLESQRRWRAFKNGLKVIGITLIIVVLILVAVTFGLRAWFISQRRRKGGKKRRNANNHNNTPQPPKKKKKVKIKFK